MSSERVMQHSGQRSSTSAGAVRHMPGELGRRHTESSRSSIRRAGWSLQTSSCSPRPPTCSETKTNGFAVSSALISSTWRPARSQVPCAARSGSGRASRSGVMSAARRVGPGARQRLFEQGKEDSVERGYMLFPLVLQHEAAGDFAAASDVLGEAARIGQRFGNADLFALAVHLQGQYLIALGRVREGFGLLDEAMVAVTTGQLSPIPTGLVYCGVIDACQRAYELRRAREWTAALTRWCAEQPDLMSFTGRCRVHRAEILQLDGAWGDALEEARSAGGRAGMTQAAHGEALYRQGEIHRLQGEFARAEEAYRDASRSGREPQPGLALLRLAQGDENAAAATIRRVLGEAAEPLRRAGLLPAYVEIMLSSDQLEDARSACRELEELAHDQPGGMLGALSSHARAAVALADGDAWDALGAAREAFDEWQAVGAPYETARARVLIALACRALGDTDTEEMELDAARLALRELGAAPDLERVEQLARPVRAASSGWADAARGRGAPSGRLGQNESGDRRRARDQREDGRPSRQQHLHQAARLLTVGGHRVRLPARARLATYTEIPIRSARRFGCFARSGGLGRCLPSGAMTTERFETVIVGGGQAGLAVGYHLARRKRQFVILDAAERVGDSWRKRWDSLHVFTPARYSGLPGMPFPGRGFSYPGKDEVADYLEAYAARFDLPVRTGVEVDEISRNGSGYVLAADGRRFEADSVVIASGAYHDLRVPAFASELDPGIVQLGSTEYRNPSQLREGGVLVVGAANSGAEIALEVARAHPTWLSGPHPGNEPFRAGSAIDKLALPLFWFFISHVATVKTPIGRKVQPMVKKGLPLARVRPKDLEAAGIERVPRTVGAREGRPELEDGRLLDVANVIWCTGFRADFGWIALPVFDEDGEPVQDRGVVVPSPGLYFVGRPFLYGFTSSLIGGVGRDAEHIAKHIASGQNGRSSQ